MTDYIAYLLAIPILGTILLIVRLFLSFSEGRDFSLTLRGLGVELSIQTKGEKLIAKGSKDE